MAVRPLAYPPAKPDPIGRQAILRWAGLTSGDTGEPVKLAGYRLNTIQVVSAIPLTGQVDGDLQGCLDPAGLEWASVHDLSYMPPGVINGLDGNGQLRSSANVYCTWWRPIIVTCSSPIDIVALLSRGD